MIPEVLLACLQSFARPEDTESWILPSDSTSAANQVAVSDEYRRAVRDLLTVLGAYSPETDSLTSPTAYYFIRSLFLAAQDGGFSEAAWRGAIQDARGGSGARLLRALETERLVQNGEAGPQRAVIAVMAVIKARRAINGGFEDVYLMQHDHGAQQFQPLGGKRELTDASSEDALTREICEELALDGLRNGIDFRLRPLIEHIRRDVVSASLHVYTRYDHSFFQVLDVRFTLNADSDTRWISTAELREGKTHDGYHISTLTMEHLADQLPALEYSLEAIVT